MPRFLSEESKQAWVEKVRAAKLAKKKAQNEPRDLDEEEGSEPVPALVVKAPDVAPRAASLLAVLNEVLVHVEADRAALERVRGILGRVYS